MSAGAIATGILLLAVFGFLYVVIGDVMDKYNEKTNTMISSDEHYSGTRREAMNNAFLVWYAFPVAVLFLFILYVILKSIQDRGNIV